MVSNVYYIHFLDTHLAEGDSEKVRFAREYVANLVGASRRGRSPSSCSRATWTAAAASLSAPPGGWPRPYGGSRRPDYSRSSRNRTPYVEDNSCVLPGSFQIRRFSTTIAPPVGVGPPAAPPGLPQLDLDRCRRGDGRRHHPLGRK